MRKVYSFTFISLLVCMLAYATNYKQTRESAYYQALLTYYTPSAKLRADKAYQDFLAQYRDYAPAYKDLICIYQEQGRPLLALKILQNYEKIFTLDKTSPLLHFLLAVQSGQYHEAEKHLSGMAPTADSLFYCGFLHYQKQRYTMAIAFLEQALHFKADLPQAYHFLGMSYYALKQYDKAIKNLTLALKIEPNFTLSLEPLAQSYLSIGDWDNALSFYKRASSRLPEKKDLYKVIKKISKQHKEEIEQKERIMNMRKTTQVIPQVSTFAQNPGPPVRIGLAENLSSLSLKTGADYTITSARGTYQGKKGDVVCFYFSKITTDDAVATKSFVLNKNDTIKLSYATKNAATTVFDIVDGRGYFFEQTGDRSYRGAMEIMGFSSGLTLVNIVPLEEYLYAVIPAEIPPYWPMEALKAQAVAARTFTLVNMGQFAKRGFDLYGSVISHAYMGIERETDTTTQAVDSTAGLVLYTDASKTKLLTTYYSANTGGYTDTENVVWNQDGPSDHVGRADPLTPVRECHWAPHTLVDWIQSRPQTYSNWPQMHFPVAYRSTVWISAEDLALTVSRSKNIGAIKGLYVVQRSISGRITRLKAVEEKGSVLIEGDAIRNRLCGLRSNLCAIQTITDFKNKPLYFVIFTAGWGHGIGIDQSGAAGMAADNYSFKQILAHYYPKGVLSSAL